MAPSSNPNYKTSPPPAYTEVVTGVGSTSTSTSQTAPPQQLSTPFTGSYSAPPNAHPNFGPTPLTNVQLILPYAYYGPRAAADTRARWRFFGGFVWAVVLYCLIALLVGSVVWDGDGVGGVYRWVEMKVRGGAIA